MLRYLTVLLLAFLVISCAQKENHKEEEEKAVKEPQLYSPSELALLMRDMERDLKAIGSSLDSGVWPVDSFSSFANLHTAKPTNPDEIDERYHAMANVFISKSEELLAQDNPKAYRAVYNELVNSCISCHQVFCTGPIARITKLQISAVKQ
jgi:cytochrome c556